MRAGAPPDRDDGADLWRDREANRRRPRLDLPLDARRRLAAPALRPRATDTVPSARASQKLKLRKLAERLHALAERAVRELEAQPDVDIDRLMQALQVVKMARLEAMGRRRPRRHIDMPARTGREMMERDAAIRTALKEMRRGGVDATQIPDDAMALLEAAHTPPERDHPALRPRGSRRR